MRVRPYLIFNGNAEEAANFYVEAFGGKIDNLTRFGDCMPDTPDEYKSKIIHLCLTIGDDAFGIADAQIGTSTNFGNGQVITIYAQNQEQVTSFYNALSQGGTIQCPLQSTFYAKQYAELTDRFGVHWALFFE